jgi:hypothetical protein
VKFNNSRRKKEMTNSIIEGTSELEDIGFIGKPLKDLQVFVKTKEDIEELESFIVNNEKDHTTNSSMAIAFREMKIKTSPISESEFISSYNRCKDENEKRECLQKLTKSFVDNRWVTYLDENISNGQTTLFHFYKAFEEYSAYQIKTIILESVLLKMEM